MKKLISFITMFIIVFQLTGFATFAGTTATDKTIFANVAEVYGAYTYDSGGFNRDVIAFTATEYAHFFRNMSTTKLIKDSAIFTSAPKYLLSKDKKKVTASYTLELPYFDIKMNCFTVFMKDKTGKIYFNDEYANGDTYSNFKSYTNIEACKKDILSSDFLPILEAENDIQNQIDQFDEQITTNRKNYKDGEALSETNRLDGDYGSVDDDMLISFDFLYDFDDTTYDDFTKINALKLYYGDETFELLAPYYLIDNDTVHYMENDHYFIEITATDRHHITKIKFVYDVEVIYEGPINLTYIKPDTE